MATPPAAAAAAASVAAPASAVTAPASTVTAATTSAPTGSSWLDVLLASRDEDFAAHTWEESKQIIASDRLELLARWPSDARRYVAWAESVRATYGSVMNFICKERLHWDPLPSSDVRQHARDSIFRHESPVPFANKADYRILRNDWPYRWEQGITHLCVWLKNRIPVDGEQGKVTAEGRRLIEAFVNGTFAEPLGDAGGERVLWYKNWTALQSVAALEHFHVLVRHVPEEVVDRWTGHDATIHGQEHSSQQ